MPSWHTRVAILVLLTSPAGCAAGQTQCARHDGAAPALRVAWIEHAPLDHVSFVLMEHEAGAILGQLGVRLLVERRDAAAAGKGDVHAVFLDSFAPRKPAVVGATLIPWRARHAARVYVFAPAVHKLFGNDCDPPLSLRRRGTALGRILAHEIVHAMAPELGHADAGLMYPRLEADSLDRTVEIDTKTLAAMRAATAALCDAARDAAAATTLEER
jgi:hypothetical protein